MTRLGVGTPAPSDCGLAAFTRQVGGCGSPVSPTRRCRCHSLQAEAAAAARARVAATAVGVAREAAARPMVPAQRETRQEVVAATTRPGSSGTGKHFRRGAFVKSPGLIEQPRGHSYCQTTRITVRLRSLRQGEAERCSCAKSGAIALGSLPSAPVPVQPVAARGTHGSATRRAPSRC